jgi:hypothetical protein
MCIPPINLINGITRSYYVLHLNSEKIDRNIFKALYSFGRLYSEDLKKKLESKEYLGYALSPDTYSSHLKNLVADAKIKKTYDEPRQQLKWVSYELTEIAKEESFFDVLQVKSNTKQKNSITREEKNQKIYHLLFFFQTLGRIVYELPNGDFRQLLSKLKMEDNDLKIIENDILRQVTTASWLPFRNFLQIDKDLVVESISSITPPYRIFVTRYSIPDRRIKIWQERYAYFDPDGQTRMRPGLAGLKKKVRGIRDSDNSIKIWRYAIPGVSVTDLLNQERDFFKHIDFTYDEAQKAFDLLKKKGRIKQTYTFLHEPRFIIADKALADAITNCWKIYSIVEEMMILTWLYLRSPTYGEMRHVVSFYGDKRSNEIFRAYHQYRHLPIERNRQKEFIESIKKDVKDLQLKALRHIEEIKRKHADTITKYCFPLNSLIELVYPTFPQDFHSKK